MANSSQKIVIKWSKRERDYMVHYPNRAGKQIGRHIFRGLDLADAEMQRCDWWKGFREYVRGAGYNPDSMKITIDPLKELTLTP